MSKDEEPDDEREIITVAQECIICGLLVLTFPNDPAPACSTHGGTS